MTDFQNFHETKTFLVEHLQSKNIKDEVINQLLSDEFVNGLIELKKQQPQDDELINILNNFDTTYK